MRKIVAVILLLLYTFGATDACQLLKLPILVQHYFTHRQETPGITLTAFLALHYQDKIIIDDDFQQDMQLPFKAMQSESCLSVVMVIPGPIVYAYTPTEENTAVHIVVNDEIPSATALHSIFQPPKV